MTIFPTGDVPFKPKHLWHNGELVSWDDAKVHVSSIGHASVSGVFEGIKAYWNESEEQLYVFRLAEHIERFFESIRLVRLKTSTTPQMIIDATLEMLRANDTRTDVYIRPWIYATGLVREMMMPPDNDANVVIDSWWFNSRMLQERGCSAAITSWTRIDDASMPPRIKAFSNYHNGRLGIIDVRGKGVDWPIFLNRNGKVTEGPASCVGIVRRGAFVTPPLSAGILDSITRQSLLEIIPEVTGLPVIERDLDRTELHVAEEILFFGTGWDVLPIVEIDGLRVGDGTMGRYTRMIDRAYHDAVRGITTRWSEWRTPVYEREAARAATPRAVWNPKSA